MISPIKHKQRISWTLLNDAMAISAKEMSKNHTDKERFAVASSYIQTGILTLLFPRKRRRSSSSPFISHRFLEAVASWILKSLVSEVKNRRGQLSRFVSFFLCLPSLRKVSLQEQENCSTGIYSIDTWAAKSVVMCLFCIKFFEV